MTEGASPAERSCPNSSSVFLRRWLVIAPNETQRHITTTCETVGTARKPREYSPSSSSLHHYLYHPPFHPPTLHPQAHTNECEFALGLAPTKSRREWTSRHPQCDLGDRLPNVQRAHVGKIYRCKFSRMCLMRHCPMTLVTFGGPRYE